jgi:hypothetical protein
MRRRRILLLALLVTAFAERKRRMDAAEARHPAPPVGAA